MSGALRVAALGLFVFGVAGYFAQREESKARTGGAVASAAGASEAPRLVAPRERSEPAASSSGSAGATSAAGRDWVRRNQDGVDAVERGDFDRAVELFEALLREAPDQAVLRANLARALAARARACRESGGALETCLVDLERAVELAPDDAALGDWVARLRRERDAEAGFASADSPYFELTFDGERGELVHSTQDFLDRLEAAYTDFRLWFGHDPVLDGGRRPFRVVLYDRDAFAALTGLGDWAAGAFDGTIRLPLEPGAVRAGEWDAVLRHELAHGFIEELGGRIVPGWLNEGLAQWLEEPRGDGGAIRRARARLAGSELLDLEELSGSLLGWGPEKIRLAYAQSLAWVAYLQEHYGAEALCEMVRGCGRGEGAAAGFQKWTRVPLGAAMDDFRRDLE